MGMLVRQDAQGLRVQWRESVNEVERLREFRSLEFKELVIWN